MFAGKLQALIVKNSVVYQKPVTKRRGHTEVSTFEISRNSQLSSTRAVSQQSTHRLFSCLPLGLFEDACRRLARG